jgi:hypothetical protein
MERHLWRALFPVLDPMFLGKSTSLERLLRVSFLLAAPLILASFGAGSANASCGDYVMIGGHGHGHGTQHGMPGVPTCHGPSCQNRVPLPALPTKGLAVSQPVDLACWFEADRSAKPRLCGQTFEPPLLLSEGHSLPLLRPPCF